jgi:hypothetical protein
MPGYPIRTPSDHSSVGNSPRNIAASHVLHRPLMPRHPPCALKNLATKDARIHYTKLKQQPHKPHTPTTHNKQTPHTFTAGLTIAVWWARSREPTQENKPAPTGKCVPSGPNSVPPPTPSRPTISQLRVRVGPAGGPPLSRPPDGVQPVFHPERCAGRL